MGGISFDDYLSKLNNESGEIESVETFVGSNCDTTGEEITTDLLDDGEEVIVSKEAIFDYAMKYGLHLEKELCAEWNAFASKAAKMDLWKTDMHNVLKLYNNPKLQESERYELVAGNIYAYYLLDIDTKFSEACKSSQGEYRHNILIGAPSGFHSLAFLHNLLYKAIEFRMNTEDKWITSTPQCGVLSTLDIKFLKEKIASSTDSVYGGLDLYEIYNSPLLCIVMCGDLNIDTEIINEIYNYRLLRPECKLWSMVVVSSIDLNLYMAGAGLNGLWADKIASYTKKQDEIQTKEERFRFQKVNTYFNVKSVSVLDSNLNNTTSTLKTVIEDLF